VFEIVLAVLARQPEVNQLHAWILDIVERDHHVLRLEVFVHLASSVEFFQGGEQLQPDVADCFVAELVAAQVLEFSQRLEVQVVD